MKITDLLFDAANNPDSEVNKHLVIENLTSIGSELIKEFKSNSQEDTIQELLHNIDQAIKKEGPDNTKQKPITCSKGCSACCFSYVTITDTEARLLVSHCKKNNISINQERLSKQAQQSIDNWMELELKDRKCVFLDDEGSCSVYDARPGVCRKHLVTADSRKCIESSTLPKNERIFNLQAELMISALWQVRPFGSMAEMLNADITKTSN